MLLMATNKCEGRSLGSKSVNVNDVCSGFSETTSFAELADFWIIVEELEKWKAFYWELSKEKTRLEGLVKEMALKWDEVNGGTRVR